MKNSSGLVKCQVLLNMTAMFTRVAELAQS